MRPYVVAKAAAGSSDADMREFIVGLFPKVARRFILGGLEEKALADVNWRELLVAISALNSLSARKQTEEDSLRVLRAAFGVPPVVPFAGRSASPAPSGRGLPPSRDRQPSANNSTAIWRQPPARAARVARRAVWRCAGRPAAARAAEAASAPRCPSTATAGRASCRAAAAVGPC